MKEIAQIREKHDDDYLRDHIESLDDINQHALVFCKDVANILPLITLQRNLKRNPTGYGLSDAPIIGLLTRITKLLELLAKFYELDNGEHIAIFSRPLIEASVVATYLLKKRR